MTRRHTDESLSGEAMGRRLALRDEQARHAETRATLEARLAETRSALDDANRAAVLAHLRSVLADPRDLFLFVELEDLVDEVGRLLWARVGAIVDEILVARPHLAAPVGVA